MKVTLNGVEHDVTLHRRTYQDGSPALLLTEADTGLPFGTATVFLVHEAPSEGCVWIKDWAENEGMLASLVEAGVIEVTGRVAQAGFVHAHEGRLL